MSWIIPTLVFALAADAALFVHFVRKELREMRADCALREFD